MTLFIRVAAQRGLVVVVCAFSTFFVLLSSVSTARGDKQEATDLPDRVRSLEPFRVHELVLDEFQAVAQLLRDDQLDAAANRLRLLQAKLPYKYSKTARTALENIEWAVRPFNDRSIPSRRLALASLCVASAAATMQDHRLACDLWWRAWTEDPSMVDTFQLRASMHAIGASENDFFALEHKLADMPGRPIAYNATSDVRLCRNRANDKLFALKQPAYATNDRFLETLATMRRFRACDHELKDVVTAYEMASRALDDAGDAPGRKACDLLALDAAERDVELLPIVLFNQAQRAAQRKEFADALVFYQRIITEYPDLQIACLSIIQTGYLLQSLGRYDEAIESFKKVLEAKLGDSEPGCALMLTNPIYQNEICFVLMACYESKRDFRHAHEWARAAADKYPFYSNCGTCTNSAKERTDFHITRLRLLAEPSPDAVFACVKIFAWRFWNTTKYRDRAYRIATFWN